MHNNYSANTIFRTRQPFEVVLARSATILFSGHQTSMPHWRSQRLGDNSAVLSGYLTRAIGPAGWLQRDT